MIKKIFVFCVAIFTCVNVEAAMYNVGDVVTMSKKSATNTILSTYFNVVDRDGNIAPTTHAHKLNEFGWNKGTLSYWATTADGIKYLAFCQDPNLNSVSGTTYKIDSVFGEDVDDKETGMYDAAMLAIFRYFGDSSVNDDAKYAAEILALRATVATFGKGASASAISEYINTAVIWNSENSELANKVISKGVRLHGAISSERVAPNANGNGVYEEAKAAYYAGLEAAANYTDGDGRAKLETNKKTLITGTNVATTVTLEAFNFIGNENSKLKSLEIIVENPSVTYTCALDGSATSCEVGEGVQLKNGSKFEIIFKAVAQESEHCDSAKFTINYGITDDTLNGDSAYSLYKSGEDETHQSLQRFSFYVMPGDENILEDTVNGGIPVCGGNCEPEYYVPTDCIEAGDPETEVNSWYNSIDYDKDADPIQCVVNKTDSAGNSYTAKTCVYGETANDSARGQENGMKYVNDNKYCTVSCSEDYKFSYSGIQDTDSGRYFRVSAKISGVKTCYTSPIDYEQFARDIKAAQEEILKYFNEYYEYEKAVGTGLTHTEGCVAGCDGGTYESYYIGYDGYGGNPVTYTDKKSFAASYNEDTGEVSSLNETTGEAKVLKSEGDKGETELNDEDETVCKTHCKSGDKKLADLKSEIEAGMKNADEKLKTAQQKYYETIQAIIACAGDNTNVDTNFSFSTLNFSDIKNWGWKMLFPYDPTIQYSYDEKYDSSISAKDKLMIATPEYAGPEHTYYACSSGNCETLKTMDSNSTSYDSGNTVKFLYCELEKGCEKVEFYNFPVKELSVVSQKSTKNIEYKTPDIFYAAFPTTNIVYSPDGAVLEDEGKDGYQYELVNGLPVELNTGQGLYNFTFKIDNIGEYYDTCEPNRLVEEFESLGIINKDSYEYVCHYRVNCPECDVDGDLDIDWPDDKCTTCLIDGVFNTVFRIVSLGNGSGDKDSFNANDRPLGYNWNYKFANSGTNYGFVGGKADATLDLIYSLGDGIYGEKPILSITLTPSMASDIRDYNKNKSYANDTLTCYDHEESGYQNIFCYSELLNDWVEIYGDNIEFDGRTGKINKDLVENFNGSYKGNAYWTIYTTNISTGYGIVGGPSWK